MSETKIKTDNRSISLPVDLWDAIDQAAPIQMGSTRAVSAFIKATMAKELGIMHHIPKGFGYEKITIPKDEEDHD